MRVIELIEQLQRFASNAGIREPDSRGVPLKEAAAQQVADELVALQSIFGSDNITLLPVQNSQTLSASASLWRPEEGIRLCIIVPLDLGDDDGADLSIRLSATLPSGYPQMPSPPQLQLLSRYIGSHGVDHSLFGQILRIFYQGVDVNEHLIFQPGEVALFEGIESVREKVEKWYSEREAEKLQRMQEDVSHGKPEKDHSKIVKGADEIKSLAQPERGESLKGITVFSSPAITERKSVFVGHAALLTDITKVEMILEDITKDKKIARASHPTIYAWICRPKADGAVFRDCNDDGETAAGGRLAHLLDLLHLGNVIVVVTRWYGGVHLGADRFKLINRAARDALEVAQLVSGPLNPNEPGSKSSNSSKRV